METGYRQGNVVNVWNMDEDTDQGYGRCYKYKP